MPFTPTFLNLSGTTDALQSLTNLQTPSPELSQFADHLGINSGTAAGAFVNTKQIYIVTTLKCQAFRDVSCVAG
jgi:hypothetical protein